MQRAIVTGAAAVLASIACPALAGTVSGSMAVSATVTETCRTDIGDLSFGSMETRDMRGSGQSLLALTCTPGTAYAISIDNGRNGNRNMVDPTGAAFLAYDIYQDAGALRRWGSGSAAVSGIAPADGRVTLNAYGRITSTRAMSGNYTDVVTVTVAF